MMKRTLGVMPLACLCAVLGCSAEEPSVVIWEPAPDDWIQASPMIEPRGNFATAALGGGRVLVAGGYATGFELASAEIFDIRSNEWTGVKPMNTPRVFATAVLLGDGTVLVIGGVPALLDDDGKPLKTLDYLDSAEVYDPHSDTWTLTSPMQRKHANPTATLLQTGQVLVVGGAGGFATDIAELFDPKTGKWSLIADMTAAYHGHTATTLPDGGVLIAGGYDPEAPLATVERAGAAADGFLVQSPMATPRREPAAALLRDGPHAGHVLVTGGATGAGVPLATAELFDLTSGVWSPAPPMKEARWLAAHTVMANGDFLVAGGRSGDGQPASFPPSATVEAYVPGQNLWRSLPPLHEARLDAAALRRGSMILIAGGSRADQQFVASVEVYMGDQPCSSTADCFAGYSCSPDGLCGVEVEQ